MLRVVSDPPNSRISYNKALVDDERDINFSIVGTLAKGAISAFRLAWQGRIIPVSASWIRVGGDDATLGYDLTDVTFNGPGISQNYDLSPFTFSSQQERADVRRVAVECLLAFGRTADGIDASPGFYGFPTEDERITLQSLGY